MMHWSEFTKKKGVGIGRWVEFNTFDGLRRKFKLNRTSIKIQLRKRVVSSFRPTEITLPCLGEEADFLLKWIDNGKEGIFEVFSLGEDPFLHNGAMVKQSYLCSRDQLDLDLNKVICLEEKKTQKNSRISEIPEWPREIPFLLEGETGTGKSSFAKELHKEFGENERGDFIGINLSALNPQLIESELFGHEKGAFTGALKQKKGAIELAEKGTLFLDEIDSLDLSMQVKLLTFLDEKLFRRVGGEVEHRANCRIIFASGRNLQKLVAENKFRADLYYRIHSGLKVTLDPLRSNVLEVRRIMSELEFEKGILIDDELKVFYERCLWPGNYRQINSHLMRKVLKMNGTRTMVLCDIDSELEVGPESFSDENVLDFVKRSHCKKVFFKCHGNYAEASRVLKISKNTLRRMIA